MSRWFSVGLSCLALSIPAFAGNPPPTQVFYVPFPEDYQLTAFDKINDAANAPINVFVTLSAATDGTVIYYDHWEDGYERDITNPVQSTTRIFGDGNPANGSPPGNAADLISAGTVFNLRNIVDPATLQSVIDYDARDKIATFKPISVTKLAFPDGTDTLLAGCVEVFERGLWGNEYRSPVGVDMPVSAAAGNFTFDENLFSYAAFAISAGVGGASVQIDKDNNGTYEETVVLAEGEVVYREAVNVGGHILADRPVQVILFTGTVDSNYASRDTSLLPVNRWSSDYFAPVSTMLTEGTVTFLYNPGASAITVNYDYRSSASAYTTASISVPAGGNARVVMSPSNGTTHFGAYRFYTTGSSPPLFYAMSAIDADAASGSNQNWDGGFTLVGKPSLTTQVLVSLGIGRDPYSATNPTQNGNPVWVTTSGNGHVQETVYVDYNGDNTGPLADPNGNRYDVAYNLRELEQLKIFDPDGDQSGMLVYTLNSTVKIAAVWGQDPSVASVAQPGLDVASLVPPLREGDAGKISSLSVDADGDGFVSAGDTLEYDIRAVNNARATIPGPFGFVDNLPADTTYVPGSTRYRYSVGGVWQPWVTVADNGSGTVYPLDGAGLSVPGNIQVGQQIQVVFKAAVDTYVNLSGGSIVNTGIVEISPYGLVLPVDWTDILYGSIGDRVWSDLDGDGVQDGGEAGINGIDVYADLNNNSIRDAGEPWDTTDSSGNYLLPGLLAGTYTVRVDPTDIAAANVGYGPTFDPDGIATTHVTTFTLAAAQDRVDADFGYRVGASIGDRVWIDRDADGVQEAGEPGIIGVRVYVDANNNNAYDVGERNTITSGDGIYYIGNLAAGTYNVRVDTTTLPGGTTQTFDLNGGLDHEAAVTLLGAEHRGDLDFGYRGVLSLGDLVWEDIDANGLLVDIISSGGNGGMIDMNRDGSITAADAGVLGGYNVVSGRLDVDGDGGGDNDDDITTNTFLGLYRVANGRIDINIDGSVTTADVGRLSGEQGIPNIRVYLDFNGNGVFDSSEPSAVTNASGIYTIGNLFNGSYTVRVDTTTLPSSYAQTYDLVSPSTDHTAVVALSGASRTDVDFGYRNDASLGDLVWNDRDADGVRDAAEPGIEGVLVYIDADNDNLFDQGVERFATTDVNGYYLIPNLSAGSYAVRIEISTLPQGAGQTYDLNGDLDHEAARTLTGSENATNVDFGYRATASVGDFVWTDSDADGIQDAGEPGISGVRVYLDINGNSAFDSATEPSSTTDSAGAYTIGNLVPGTYTARVDPSTLTAGLLQTHDAAGGLDHAATFSLSASQVRTDIDFGYTAPVSIGNFAWHDQDGDGQQDVGEPGLAGVTVTACNAANDAVVGTFTTLAGGAYSFSGLLPGSYYVIFGALPGYQQTLPDQGADATDSDANRTTGRTPSVTLTGGQSNLTLDAGYFQPGIITGTVFADTNNDNTGDVAISAVTLTLKDSSGNDIDSDANTAGIQPTVTTTNASGVYTFSNLPPGSYRIVETQPSGYLNVSDVDGLNNNVIGDQTPVTLTSGQTRSGNNFVEEQPGTISGTVFADTNNDNVGDVGIAGVTLTLYTDPNGDGNRADGVAYGSPVATIAGGTYSFTSLPPGAYVVEETQPSGYLTVTDVDSTTPGDDASNTSTTDNSIPAAVTANETDTGNDFIEEQPGVISGTVFADTDNNDTGDVAISGVTITLKDSSGNDIDSDPNTVGIQPTTAITNASGVYTFSNVSPGSYRVVETQPAGYLTVTDGDTTTPGDDAANVSATDNFIPVSVTAGETDNGNNFVEEQPGTISGTVFADTDNNDTGDVGIAGVTLTLYSDPNGDGNPADGVIVGAPFVTLSGGAYSYTNLAPGAYVVVETQPFGYLTVTDVDATTPGDDAANSSTTDNAIPAAVTANETDTGNNFIEEQPGTISGTVFADTDNNDTGDVGIAGVTLTLYSDPNGDGNPSDGVLVGSPFVTIAGGAYSFTSLAPGAYVVVETQPAGYLTVTDVDATSPGDDVANSSTSDNAIPAAVTANETDTGNNFIEEQPGVISGSVFADTDNNDTGDVGIAGVTLTLYSDPNGDGNPSDGVVVGSPFVTLAGGAYSFTNLAPGAYVVVETQPSGYLTVTDVDAATPGDDAANSSTTDNAIPAAVTANETDNGNNFIEEQPGTISGTVFADTDNNDTGDVAISGVTITLRDSSGNDVDSDPSTAGIQPTTTTTNASGVYTFSNVPPGSYRVVETQPAGYLTVTDGDSTTPGDDAANVSTADNFIPVSVTAGETDNGNNFIEEQPGTISGNVFADTDNNDTGDVGIIGVTLSLYSDPNGDGNPADGVLIGSPVTTIAGGTYSFTNLPPGSYVVVETQPAGYFTVTDVDSTTPGDDAANSSATDNSIPAAVIANETDTGNDFIEEQPGSISGTVHADTDDDGDGDVPLAGVTIRLMDNAGNPVLDGFGDPVVTTTLADGSYSFTDLPPGSYRVYEDQPSGYNSVSDIDGLNNNRIGDETPVIVTAGNDHGGNDFVEIELGAISGYVYVGSNPLANVTLTLLDEFGVPVDGDPDTPGIQPIETVTDSLGYYQFTGIVPGVYQVAQMQPYGYDSFGDIDGGDIDIVGDVTPVTIAPGQHSQNNNFIETLDTCPDNWDEWKFQHPGETAAANPDADAYDNFAEFAFAMPDDAGTGSPWLGSTAWIIRPSALAPGTIEGVFVRPVGAPDNVTYTLQYAATPGNPTVWQSIVITPLLYTAVDNGDCTETVTLHDLEALTGLTEGKGVVRIQADLDDGGGGDGDIDHTSHTETEGWTVTGLEICCRTYNNPYQRETAFTGTVTGVNGQDLAFAAGDDLGQLLSPGGTFYLEVTSGDNEGQRFDLVSAGGDTVTLANDGDLHAAAAPFNTLTGPPPASLAGDRISIRRHWTLAETFPTLGLGASGSQSAADQIQIFANGAWVIYWLYDGNDADPLTARWVDAADAGMSDMGATVIPPGQGAFFNNRTAVTSIMAYGEIRANDFIRPHAPGNNLVGGGYPVDQSANGPRGRAMNVATGFFGSPNFKTADSIFIWKADTTIGAPGYDTYYLVGGIPSQPSLTRWVKVGDASILPRDLETLLQGNRSVITRTANGVPAYTVPNPWTP